MTITIDTKARRLYLRENSHPFNDQLRDAGCKSEPDAKCWCTNKRGVAEQLVEGKAP